MFDMFTVLANSPFTGDTSMKPLIVVGVIAVGVIVISVVLGVLKGKDDKEL